MNLKKLTDPVVSKLKSQCSINVWKCNFQAASDSVTHTGKRASQTNHQKREFSKRKQRNIFLLRILDLAFLLLSNMQNGFIRTKVGVSLKKKFSLEKSEKKSKKPGFSLIKLQFVTSRGADLQGESRRVCNVANSAKCKVRAVRALPRSFSLLLANLELTRPDF